MTKTEMVKKGIEHCFEEECMVCPYSKTEGYCKDVLRKDFESMNLIEKESESQEPEWEGGGWQWFPVCPECHGIISDYAKTCPHCQTPLVWEK